ncbi:rpoE leader peptide RseD [Kosakonia calanthes]|uniref:rpoE leader peptide RseD n=1 Tax=Kosakonia calanthes TaxID=3139408 RepID=UPI003CC7C624
MFNVCRFITSDNEILWNDAQKQRRNGTLLQTCSLNGCLLIVQYWSGVSGYAWKLVLGRLYLG